MNCLPRRGLDIEVMVVLNRQVPDPVVLVGRSRPAVGYRGLTARRLEVLALLQLGGGAPLVQVRRTPHPPAAAGTPVSLRDTIAGLDDRNTTLLITAIQHAAGNYSLADDRSRLR